MMVCVCVCVCVKERERETATAPPPHHVSADERRGNNFKYFKDSYLQAKAKILYVPCSVSRGERGLFVTRYLIVNRLAIIHPPPDLVRSKHVKLQRSEGHTIL